MTAIAVREPTGSTHPGAPAVHITAASKVLDSHIPSTDIRVSLEPATTTDSSEDTHGLDQALIAPESWQIRNDYYCAPDHLDIPMLTATAMEVLTWLRHWASTGSTLFIHWRIYHDAMPRCLQDAYTSCATYFASSDRTKDFAFRIIERNVEELVHNVKVSELTGASEPCSLVQHLARTQALLTYQAIRLYDGDIRQRAAADKQCSTLYRWNHEMLTCALESSEYVRAFSGGRSQNDTAAWHAWCLAESVRRTWATSNVVQNAYHVLKGEHARCPGHLFFTARAGLWDARSCLSWMKAHKDQDPLFYNDMKGRDILTKAKPHEVDEFAKWALGVTYADTRLTGLPVLE